MKVKDVVKAIVEKKLSWTGNIATLGKSRSTRKVTERRSWKNTGYAAGRQSDGLTIPRGTGDWMMKAADRQHWKKTTFNNGQMKAFKSWSVFVSCENLPALYFSRVIFKARLFSWNYIVVLFGRNYTKLPT